MLSYYTINIILFIIIINRANTPFYFDDFCNFKCFHILLAYQQQQKLIKSLNIQFSDIKKTQLKTGC